MNEENPTQEFKIRNTIYIQVQAGAFIGMALFALVLRLLGFDDEGQFFRNVLMMLPAFVLLPVIFNLSNWPVHRNNRIKIDDRAITGPVQIGKRLESQTLLLSDIDRQRTEAASFYAKLFGPMKIYAMNGDSISLDVIGLGRVQIRKIYKRIGCEAPPFPMDSIVHRLGHYVEERKKDLLNILLIAISGVWFFMIFVEGLNIMQSTLAAYLMGIASGMGIIYCFTQLTKSEQND